MTLPTRIIYLIPGDRKWKLFKHSDAVTDFQLDWREFLESSESISSQTVTASNITVDSESSSGQVSTIFVSGGTANSSAYIDVTIVTDNATARTFKVRLWFYFETDNYYEDDYYYV